MVGGGAYQRIALIADWTRNLPPSLTDYFRNQAEAQSIGRFCTSVLPPTALLTLLAFGRELARPLAAEVERPRVAAVLRRTGLDGRLVRAERRHPSLRP